MAKKSIVPLVIRDSFTSATSEQSEGEYKTIDVSAYVDPLNGRVLQVKNVTMLVDNGSGLPVDTSDFSEEFDFTTQLLAGSQTGLKAASDDRVLASKYWNYGYNLLESSSGAYTARGIRTATEELKVPDMGYYLAADTMTMIQLCAADATQNIRFMWIIECMRVKLSAQDVNFLLVNQTQTQ